MPKRREPEPSAPELDYTAIDAVVQSRLEQTISLETIVFNAFWHTYRGRPLCYPRLRPLVLYASASKAQQRRFAQGCRCKGACACCGHFVGFFVRLFVQQGPDPFSGLPTRRDKSAIAEWLFEVYLLQRTGLFEWSFFEKVRQCYFSDDDLYYHQLDLFASDSAVPRAKRPHSRAKRKEPLSVIVALLGNTLKKNSVIWLGGIFGQLRAHRAPEDMYLLLVRRMTSFCSIEPETAFALASWCMCLQVSVQAVEMLLSSGAQFTRDRYRVVAPSALLDTRVRMQFLCNVDYAQTVLDSVGILKLWRLFGLQRLFDLFWDRRTVPVTRLLVRAIKMSTGAPLYSEPEYTHLKNSLLSRLENFCLRRNDDIVRLEHPDLYAFIGQGLVAL